MSLSVSDDGQYFIHQCERCGLDRRERIDPDINPRPFDFIMLCSCGQRIDCDLDLIFEVQQSYIRAKRGRI